MNFDIEGLDMYVTKNYHFQSKLLKVFQKSKQNMMRSAKMCERKEYKEDISK